MLKTGGKISIIAIIIIILGMTLLHQSREYESYYTPFSNEGYVNVNYFQREVETDSLVSPIDYYYYSYSEIGLFTLSLISIVVAIYLLVVRMKEGVFFNIDKVKLGAVILVLLVSLLPIFLYLPNNPNTGVVDVEVTNKLLLLICSLIPIGVLFFTNLTKLRELRISSILTIVFFGVIFYLSFLDMYWFLLVIEFIGSIILVSLLLDDFVKVNTTVYM